MRKLIVANWKMNPVSKNQAKEIFSGIRKGADGASDAVSAQGSGESTEVVVCPPFVWLAEGRQQAAEGGFALGAQNCFWEEKGAFTGEVSAQMLKDLGVEYVIIGHSERRKYFAETDELVNKKIKKSLEAELKIIFCIGETAEERDVGKKQEVLERQIKFGLKDLQITDKLQITVAYEPIWAIGTGNNCSVEETEQSINFIRKFVPDGVRILYGGSVKNNNSADYIRKAGADGLLVGGASLDPEEFVKIIKSAE